MNSETKILLYSGQIKKLKDVAIGEELMAYDSTPLKVLDVKTTPTLLSYTLTPKIGDAFTVVPEKELILLLKNNKKVIKRNNVFDVGWYSRSDSAWFTKTFANYSEAKHFSETLQSNDILKITPLELYYHSELIPRCLIMKKGVTFSKDSLRSSGSLHSPSPDSLHSSGSFLSPYLIGVWAGKKECYDSKINDYLKNNSSISSEYTLGPCEIRKKVLAGILDSKGTYLNEYNCFEINFDSYYAAKSHNTQNEQLISDILFISRSLGYLANYYNNSIFITGDFTQLPLQINRNYQSINIELACGFTLMLNEKSDKTQTFTFTELKFDVIDKPVLLADFSLI